MKITDSLAAVMSLSWQIRLGDTDRLKSDTTLVELSRRKHRRRQQGDTASSTDEEVQQLP